MIESRDGDVPKSGQNKWQLTRTEVAASINPHLLTQLKIEPYHEVKLIQPTELLTPMRLDVMAKYIYALEWTLGKRAGWGLHVYREHLRIWNEFREGDRSGKSSFEDFRKSFDELLTRVAEDRFDDRRGLLPIGAENVIIDGSHRVAAALALNAPVKVVCFSARPQQYNYEFFRERGLAEEILDDLVLQYCRLDARVRVGVFFPVTNGRDQEMMTILEESGAILYHKSVTISRRGRENLIKLLYRGESWLGDGTRPTPGLLQHVTQRFIDHEPVRFVFFLGNDGEKNRRAKASIRALFDLGNDPVHINDTHQQTISIAESVLNANSLHFLNNALAGEFKNFSELFKVFKDWMKKDHLDRRLFCIDGSAVLAAYGLRDANDLDYLCARNPVVQGPNALVSCHNAELSHYDLSLDDLVMDPRNYFYFDGMKFLSIDLMRKMKAARGEAKDLSDVYRIDALEGKVGFAGRMLKAYYTLPERIYSLRFQALRSVKQIIPEPILPLARTIYRLPRLARGWFGPQEQVSIYRGFELHYSRGTSLLEWIEGGRIYEPEVARHLIQALNRSATPICLDIGANIGLMTLNILAEIPNARVVAFEPGPHQAELLERNVTVNHLKDRVTVIRTALSNRVGVAQFSVHRSKHASGDGFFDTCRAGRTKMTEVQVATLDVWWRNAGQPHVDAVKIDTEGAELWVLEGGISLLEQCHPFVVFEMHPKNLQVYPYKAADILRFFNEHNYTVRAMDGVKVSEANLVQYLDSANDYIALFGHD